MTTTAQQLIEAITADLPDGPMTVEIARSLGYPVAWEIAPGVVMAVCPFMFTVGLIGPLTRFGYEQRWCYHTLGDLLGAWQDWKEAGFVGEPEGWHRHTPTHRRRQEGREWIQP